MRNSLVFILFLGLLLLTACSQQPPGNPLDSNHTPPGEVEDPFTVEPSADHDPPLDEAPSAADDEDKDSVHEVAEIVKTHRMNSHYFIVPKDPEGDKKVVLLTFDDGPKEAEQISRMIEVLDQHQAKAIFFVNGYRVKQNPELLKQLHNAGQVIGNHSWDHINLRELDSDEAKQQIVDVQNIVEELTGSRPEFFRPPFGSANDRVKDIVKHENMLFMTWSNGSEDWVKQYQTPEGVTFRVLEQLAPGSNILMHELPWTIEALDGLLTAIEDKGYSFIDPRAIEIVETPHE